MSITVTHVKGPETGSPNKQLHQANISVPLPAVLGRGALLKCAEKKVSRRHATLDWDDDGVIINSVNQNPTFVCVGGNRQKLNQGESVVLGNGDTFGLLEDTFWFRITLENSTQLNDKENTLLNSIEPKQEHGNIKELKSTQENGNAYLNHNQQIIKSKEYNLKESNNAENGNNFSKKGEATEITYKVSTEKTVSEYIQKNLPHLNSSATSKDQNNVTEDSSKASLSKETKLNASSLAAASTSKQLFNDENNKANTPNDKEVKVCQILYTQKEIDGAVNDRKRTLPAWMSDSSSSTNTVGTSNKKESHNAVQHGRKNVKATPKKQNKSEVNVYNSKSNVDNVEMKEKQKKSPRKTPKTTPSKYHGMSQNDEDEIIMGNSVIEKEESSERNKSPLQRSPKASPSKKTPSKYHGISQDNSDKEISDKEDIEMRNYPTENRHDFSDDGSGDNVNYPKNNLPSLKKLKTPDKKYPGSDDNGSDDNDSNSEIANKTKITVGNRLAGVTTTDDAGVRGRKRAAPRGSCAYGSQCYRKNPQHKDEYAHPGDSDYNEDDDDEEGGDDDERPECEFGVDCYRKNPQHRKQFRHTRLPQPQRKAKRKARTKKDGSNDSESDDYDYDDPFLNDDSSDEYAPTDSGSDTNVEDNDEEEDTDRMLKEGRKFIKEN